MKLFIIKNRFDLSKYSIPEEQWDEIEGENDLEKYLLEVSIEYYSTEKNYESTGRFAAAVSNYQQPNCIFVKMNKLLKFQFHRKFYASKNEYIFQICNSHINYFYNNICCYMHNQCYQQFIIVEAKSWVSK